MTHQIERSNFFSTMNSQFRFTVFEISIKSRLKFFEKAYKLNSH